MAYWVHQCGNAGNMFYRSFRCDYESDIDKLPTTTTVGEEQEGDTVSGKVCAAGSDCLCLENSSRYVLGKDTDKWTKVNTSSESSSGSDDDSTTITESAIDALF